MNIDYLNIFILKTIDKNKNIGTMELSKKVNLAPKNLINRLNKLYSFNLISKDKKSLKPKGWSRIWILTGDGNKLIKANDRYNNTINFIQKNFKEVENKVLGTKGQEEIHNLQEIKNQNEKLAIKIWNEYKSSYGNRIRDIDNIYIRRLVMGAINQATLKGIKLQMEDEIKFLEDLSEEYWKKHFSMVINKIDNKIKELKQEIKDGN